jgi:uncharacterized membrane protein YgcG
MKRAAFGLLLLLISCLAGAQGFDIDTFDADLTLQRDGSMKVVETIVVTFTEPHHGIFREIPVDLQDGRGFSRSINLDHIQVTDERNDSRPIKVSKHGPNVNIRIGDKDHFEPVGIPLTYVVRYEVFNQMNWFDSDTTWQPYCELYWNLTGHEWQAAMSKVRFTVHFPPVAISNDVRARLYVGPYGSRDYQELTKASPIVGDPRLNTHLGLTKSELTGSLDRTLSPGEELTLVLDLPAGAIAKPTFAQKATIFLRSNLGLLIPFVAIIFMSIMWMLYGKDPAKKPIAVSFEPPEGLGGAETGTLLDERVDQRDLAAGIISLAVKGYLTLTPSEEGMVFKKRSATIELTGTGTAPLTTFESLLLTKLGNCTQPISDTDLRIHVAPHLAQLQESLYDTLITNGYYVSNPQSVRVAWSVGGIIVVAGLAFLCALMHPTGEVMPSIVGGILGAVIVVLFAMIMPRRTYTGAEAWRKVKGFEEFIRRARGKEIDWASKKEPTAALFEEYLPHAIAFGLAAEWAAAFDGIIHEMPSWYRAPYGTPFYPGYFGNDMVAIGDSLGSAAGTPPRSSGASGGSSGFSSGGGFSGGGFGGGGGGSW